MLIMVCTLGAVFATREPASKPAACMSANEKFARARGA